MGRTLYLEPSLACGSACQLRPVAGARLFEDAANMELDRVGAPMQPFGDLAIGEPFHDHAQHLGLEIAQLGPRRAAHPRPRLRWRGEDRIVDGDPREVTEHLEEA